MTRIPSRRALAAVALASTASLLLAACSGADDGAPAGESASGSAAAAAPSEIVVAGPVAVLDLDPLGAQAMEDATLIAAAHVYDTLVTLEDGELLPRLATSWDNPDPTTWVFTLRDDVTFHDGTPLTAQDVAASIDRVIAEEGPLAPLWSTVELAEATSDTELKVTTTEPFGGMLVNLSLLPVTPASQTEFTEAIGSGPFKVESFTSGEELVLVANEDYWDGAPDLSRIEFRNIPEASSRVTALINGEIDFTWGLSPDQFPEVEGVDGITFTTAPSYQHYYAWFNPQHEPFDDVRVRQAVAHAIDWDTIMDSLFPGIATRATAPIPESVFGYAANEPYEYDPELARELLAEAGLADGFSTTMQFSTSCCAQIQEIAQAMASDLSKVGIDVELLGKETGKWVEDLLALDWDINLANNVTVTGDANFTTGRLYTCAANRTGYCNDDLDALIADAQSSVDDAERSRLWGEAGALIWDEAVGLYPFDIQQNYAYSDQLQGFEPPVSGNPVFRDVSLNG